MCIRDRYKPVTPGTRFAVVLKDDSITDVAPEKSLLAPLRSKAGRNSAGRISIRHRGGGCRRHYRIVDFKRDKVGIDGKVVSIEYDPNRSANIALVQYMDGEKRYILAPNGLKVGQIIVAGQDVEPVVGNALPLEKIPVGIPIHNIELEPGRGGKLVRSAGLSAQLMAKEGGMAQIRLPSGEIRIVNAKCMATIGQVGRLEHSSVSLGKAGRKRWLGIRPTVRGVAMNPIDHPMGGGEGRTSGGGHPRSPWGKLAKGGLTRRKRKPSNRFILKRRK